MTSFQQGDRVNAIDLVPKSKKLGTAVYRPKMAPFGFKLWENAFQMIPDISFFDTDKELLANIFDENFRQKIFRWNISKLPVLEELWLFGRNRQMCLENDPRSFDFQLSTNFGRRVKQLRKALIVLSRFPLRLPTRT